MNIQSVNMQVGSSPPGRVGETAGAEAKRPVLVRMPGTAVPEQQMQGQGKGEEKSRDEMLKIIEGINAVLSRSGSHIKFVEHQSSQRMMVQILDDQSGEVIRTIPSKEMLDLAARISEMIGVFLDRET